MKHIYKKNYISFCKINLIGCQDKGWVGYVNINEAQCEKCLKQFIKQHNRLYKNNKKEYIKNEYVKNAQSALKRLEYKSDFDIMVREELK